MRKRNSLGPKRIVSASLALTLLSAPLFSSQANAAGNQKQNNNPGAENVRSDKQDKALKDLVNLRLMETTDIHTNLLPYDYYKDAPYEKVGLAKAATLVKQARQEVKNSVLVDNGDLIQGTPLGTYKAKIDPLKREKTILPLKR